MPRFLIMINGEFRPNAQNEMPDPAGVSATRAVDAATLGAAVDAVLAAVQKEFAAAPHVFKHAVADVRWVVEHAREVAEGFTVDLNLARIGFLHIDVQVTEDDPDEEGGA